METTSDVRADAIATRDWESSVTQQFHRINSVISDHRVSTVNPETPVSEALRLMREKRYSQLPVAQGTEVLGVFSYRSFSTRVLQEKLNSPDYSELPVRAFLERLKFLDVREDLNSAFSYLDLDDAVLIGQENNLQAIVTAMDILRYLYQVSTPFVIIGEIELTLRNLIKAILDDLQLIEAIETCNGSVDEEYRLPRSLEDMTFKHYELLISHSRNWPRFERVFGSGSVLKNMTRARLAQIGDLRNIVFHFRRELNSSELADLADHRFWMLNTAREYEGRRRGLE